MRVHYAYPLVALAMLGLATNVSVAQQYAGQSPEANENIEALMRGPIHEAFASQTSTTPMPGITVPKQPLEPVREVPPDVRPEGQNVEWIPGYWAWSEDRDDFIWISGVWREVPPNRRWVPGYWTEVDNGYQWISGAWVEADTEQMTYLPYPPDQDLEEGPTSPAPSDNYFWVPGCWRYYETGYRWRPGYWAEHQPNWIWVPAHYTWTPRGCIYVGGYWDYYLDRRGVLFSPVYFRDHHYYRRPGFYYRPAVVVRTPLLTIHLFARPHYHHYYFGDYYGHGYADRGFYPWYRYHRRAYDPLYVHYRWRASRRGIDLDDRLRGWHNYFERHPDLRPPHTFARLGNYLQQHRDQPAARIVDYASTLDRIRGREDLGFNLTRLPEDQRSRFRDFADRMQDFSRQRRDVEGDVLQRLGRGADRQALREAIQSPQKAFDLPKLDRPLFGQRGPEGRRGPDVLRGQDQPDRPDALDRLRDRVEEGRGPEAGPPAGQPDPGDQQRREAIERMRQRLRQDRGPEAGPPAGQPGPGDQQRREAIERMRGRMQQDRGREGGPPEAIQRFRQQGPPDRGLFRGQGPATNGGDAQPRFGRSRGEAPSMPDFGRMRSRRGDEAMGRQAPGGGDGGPPMRGPSGPKLRGGGEGPSPGGGPAMTRQGRGEGPPAQRDGQSGGRRLREMFSR